MPGLVLDALQVEMVRQALLITRDATMRDWDFWAGQRHPYPKASHERRGELAAELMRLEDVLHQLGWRGGQEAFQKVRHYEWAGPEGGGAMEGVSKCQEHNYELPCRSCAVRDLQQRQVKLYRAAIEGSEETLEEAALGFAQSLTMARLIMGRAQVDDLLKTVQLAPPSKEKKR